MVKKIKAKVKAKVAPKKKTVKKATKNKVAPKKKVSKRAPTVLSGGKHKKVENVAISSLNGLNPDANVKLLAHFINVMNNVVNKLDIIGDMLHECLTRDTRKETEESKPEAKTKIGKKIKRKNTGFDADHIRESSLETDKGEGDEETSWSIESAREEFSRF